MATRAEYWAALDQDYVAWLKARGGNPLQSVTALIQQAARDNWNTGRLRRQVEQLNSFTRGEWAAAVEEEPPVTEEMLAEEEAPFQELAFPEIDTYGAADVRAILTDFLRTWGLEGLAGFVENAIAQKMSPAEIMLQLRETAVYKQAFPENAMRKAEGLSWWSESQILEYRDTARRLLRQYLGITDVTNVEIAGLVAGEVALPEWERRLQTYKAMQQWGPAVKQALEEQLGHVITDDRVFAFMNPDIPTPELDEAYQMALFLGQPAMIGLGLRPEEEAQLLRQFGYSPEEAFQNYQGIAQELPRQERMALIEKYLNAQSGAPDIGLLFQGTAFGELFTALQLKDPDALERIRRRTAREHARWAAGGGAVRSGTATVGLLTADER